MAMSKPFDATMRELIELGPAAWLRFLHIPIADPACVLVIDSNLSTVTADADKVLLVNESSPWNEHVELQAGRDIELADRVHGYSTLLRRRRKVPVHTTIVLLRPAANGSELTGTHELRDRHGDVYDWFRYRCCEALAPTGRGNPSSRASGPSAGAGGGRSGEQDS
jgi:hypothetical protein